MPPMQYAPQQTLVGSTLVTDDIIPTGKITGISRREDIFDTEAWAAATAINDIKAFRNYSAFAAGSSITVPKQEYIDTNLGGATAGGLPNAMVFIWYKWRSKIRTKNANMTTDANQPVWEEIRRIRQLTSKIVNFGQSKYITCQGDETIGFTDSEAVATTKNDTIVPTPFLGGGPNGAGKDVTINGLPREISSLQDFNIETFPITIPSGVTPAIVSPTVQLFVTEMLGGVLTRGVAA